ncbi:FoF1 ATP synthase subunit delta/epsilon [Candidatus Bandiella euplotis]|uniref:ATP synthase epsilon chain n=1 Tax=Candidatus Bandiella euplotis TaxID=1664265 RepID=A0ABZ0UQF6_9RICK|nr:F0F1 ATP synthase subunit epsilon [Candidatus Bandiella woodruffii]WPX96245.1 ATP synthase subunit epsilon [Candidatus Bandiella woodruffii]
MQKDKIRLRIITPEKIIVDECYKAITLPGEAGDFQLLANHENFISQLSAGIVYTGANEDKHLSFVISRSFAKFIHEQNLCEVISEYALSMTDIKKMAKGDVTKKLANTKIESEIQFYQFIRDYILR